MSASNDTLITKSRHLLWFHVAHPSDGTVRVQSYHPPKKLLEGDKLEPQDMFAEFQEVFSNPRAWESQLSSTDRIMAQIADRPTRDFFLHYYSIGAGDDDRLASYFILDAEEKRPELPGTFDWQAPVPLKSIEQFFGLTKKKTPKEWAIWKRSNTSFKSIHHYTILFRQRDAKGEYIGADVTSQLHQYPYGRLIGGLPFGAEGTLLVICRPDKNHPSIWKQAFRNHKQLFSAWNVICRKGSELTRVFIEGNPGSGKELWVEAIQHGSSPHRNSEKWKKLSATLPIADLKLLLYGERDGAFERPGFLASCAGGGVFLDEIGKSDPTFRKDLLRVLEAGEFVPIGGLPTKTENVLYVFASTHDDKENAPDPPDFWTRMDVELTLPEPIKLRRPTQSARLLSPYDKARFHALLSHFWVQALKEQMKDRLLNDEDRLLEEFEANVFKPIVIDLAVAARKWSGGLTAIPVSPRRIRALALTLASEHQWIGYKIAKDESGPDYGKSAGKDYREFRRRFVKVFFDQLAQDEQNVQNVKKETKRRRRLGLA